MTVLAVEISKQYFKVSSESKSAGFSHEWERTRPRRLIFIRAGMAPSFESARIVMSISGELVINTAMHSPFTSPFPLKKAANRSTSAWVY